MQVDDPPYISVGTAVSAKYKGAFCEAKVSKVVRVVKCKVNYKMGGTSTVTDEQIKGTLRVGHTVQAKHPEKKEFVEAVIGKIQDCSQYTVVFDDGDITTLRRTALCMKSGRHFNESETLDQLPLTNPEHFGNPVMGGRRGRRYKQEDSSEGEGEEENEPDLEGYSTDVGRVISVEATDKKRNKDNWFPALVVIPSAQPTVRINVKDEYLVRSFKDGRYYTVPKKEISDFSRELAGKVDSSVLAEAVNKAVAFLDNNELPVHWERNSLFNMQSMDSDSEENLSEVSDGQPNEEKDRFVAQLYNFMDDSGTPLNKSPVINKQDVDLHRMFRAVHKLGGYNRVTNQNKWRSVTTRLRLPNTQITYNQVKGVYRKYLLSYEGFYKNLGVTMLNHNRAPKKNRGRSLIRDKDRVTPANSPKPEKDEDSGDKKEVEKPSSEDKVKTKIETKIEEKIVKRKEILDNSDTNSSDATDQSEPLPSTSRDPGRPRRVYNLKEKKLKPVETKPKPIEVIKKEEDEKQIQIQQTRSKSQAPKEVPKVFGEKKKEVKPPEKLPSKIPKKIEDDKKRGKKKLGPDEKASVEIIDPTPGQSVNVGDKLKVYYGPTHESKVTYEAKVLEIDKDPSGPVYLVHYTGWNNRYDEWIPLNRIAENLSAATKAKRLKQNAAAAATPSSKNSPNKTTGKRGRGMSITGRSTEAPRSTTPSSVTSSSSRTKSPATPATRSTSRITRQDQGRRTRRTSAQTDASVISDSDSETESESEMTRTRSGTKSEDLEIKRRKPSRIPTKTDKMKDDNEMEKDETRRRKAKKSPEKSEDSDDETGTNPPKGRDFDLNQIRSELKGFAKAIKAPSLDTGDKEALSSSDDSLTPKIEEIIEVKMEKSVEKSPSSDDIYEFKEPEPFEYESRPKLGEEKGVKKRLVPRLFEDSEKKGKIIKSPVKDKESPEGERKRFRRTPVKKIEDSDDDDDDDKRDEDPFDKLVESPSFNVVRSAKLAEVKQKAVSNILEAPLSLFRDLSETVDGFSRDNMDLSDTESQTPIFSREHELFSDSFGKASPDRNVLDLEFSSKSDDLKKEDFCRKIASSSEESNEETDDDLMVTHSSSSYQGKKREPEPSTSKVEVPVSEVKEETKSPAPQISPALQETDSSLLEAICATPPVSIAAKLEEVKDLNLKTGTKIADSILQKFNSIKNSADKSPKRESDCEQDLKTVSAKTDLKLEEKPLEIPKIELKTKPSEIEAKKPLLLSKTETPDVRKKRKPLSRAFIEESDSDSSDSEQLIIARSDEDSQTNSLDKPDLKESDSNLSIPPVVSTDDSQSQEEQRNFKFDTVEKSSVKEALPEPESAKEDDSQLHSLLLCEETFPTSPAPATSSEGPAVSEQRTKTKSVLEMPFASAPGTSNNKNMLLNIEHKEPNKPKPPPLVFAAEPREHVSAVLDNTPPTTPESTLSNLSPRGDPEELSPNTVENESGKSNEAEPEFVRKRRSSSLNKPSMFSEDDSQMTSEATTVKKPRDDIAPAPCKKRRKSARAAEEVAPVKRGRKPLNRSRHNSDSDDTSEHSISTGANVGLSFERRSPRPSKYNFFVEFDPNMNSEQRISVLQQKLSQLRKTYAEVKTELATVERRRKKIRRREREAMKASKQELACA